MSNKNFYEVLEISRSASAQEIKKAYLKLAKKYHPDRNSGDLESEKIFKEISHAYDILKDDQKKATYDSVGHSAFEQGNSNRGSGGFYANRGFADGDPGINDIFGNFFTDFMKEGKQTAQRSSKIRGSDLKYNLSISLEAAFKGVDKKINFSTEVKCSPCSGKGTKDVNDATNTCTQCRGAGVVRMQQNFFTVEQTCNKCSGVGQIIRNVCAFCHGTGRHSNQKHLMINVPAGIENNTRIKITGEGEAGIRGGSSSDLYVFINIKPHNFYKVEGNNLHCKLPLSFTKATLGGEVKIPIIEGSKVTLKIPAGTETGDSLRLKGKGMSKVRSLARGDLYAHVYIQTPQKLSKKQKELLEELDKEFGKSNDEYKNEDFFSKMKNMWF